MSQQQPLLLQDESTNKSLHPHCPGCRLKFNQKGAKLPLKLLFFMGFNVLCNTLAISVLYPFVYFMVKDFHVAKSEEDIGYYAGWIGSSFMAGRAITGLFWGHIADKYGRKPVMYMGVVSVIVLNTLFGLSTNFPMALITRFILGMFNGNLGVIKAYASEICSEEHQAKSVATVGTAWGFGLIIGPAIGGYLAQPALKFPNIFSEDGLFGRYPYLLQALCVTSFAVVGLFVTTGLPETLHKNHDEQPDVEKLDGENNEKTKGGGDTLWRNWPLMASLLVYCLWSLHDIAYTEIFSLWSVSQKSYGGLGFTSSDVGAVLAASGFGMLGAQLLLFPAFARAVGPIGACRYPAFLTIPLLVAYPYFNKIQGDGWVFSTALCASVLKYVLTVSAMTGSFMLINNTVKQSQRGTANGLSLSVVSVFKAIGPATGGIVFAWTQGRRNTWFLPGDYFVFFFLNIFALLTALATFEPFLPKSANKLIEED